MSPNNLNTPAANPDDETINKIAEHYTEIIRLLGDDPEREGLAKTPRRAAKAMYYATKGYRQDTNAIVNGALFTHDGSRMVIVRDIEFYSLCEHHILPFFGHMTIGYVPNGKIIGLSKVARIVDMYARRLQVQERLTSQVCYALMNLLGAKGVMVHCNAHHLCMQMRGVEKQDATTTTVDYSGVFATDPSLRGQFIDAISS